MIVFVTKHKYSRISNHISIVIFADFILSIKALKFLSCFALF